jgi:hypothetical protein
VTVDGDWQWMANTLNPYNERTDDAVRDDRLLLFSHSRWSFGRAGADDTGDIMTVPVMSDMCETAARRGGYHLVTADGSFGCQVRVLQRASERAVPLNMVQDAPGEQETLTIPLQTMEAIIAVRTLLPGGAFVWKRFTLFEKHSIGVMDCVRLFCNTICLLQQSSTGYVPTLPMFGV